MCASSLIGTAFSRMTRAEPVISSTVSPFMRSAVMYAAIWASVASPCMISRITASASASVRFVLVMTFAMASLIIENLFGRRFTQMNAD